MQHIQPSVGKPFPLGVSRTCEGWNFAIYSLNPISELIIRTLDGTTHTFPFNQKNYREGNVWHMCLNLQLEKFYYGYKVTHPENDKKSYIVHDPYAPLLDSGNTWGKSAWHTLHKIKTPFAFISIDTPFDWEGDVRLQHAKEDLLIYEMHVRGFTKHESSNTQHAGTYLGIKEKVAYFKELGITAIEILPIHEFDETEYPRINPITQEVLYNYWGYSSLSFFSPMQRYAASPKVDAGAREFKEMVLALHKEGIEVLIDVVFNHTGEGNEDGRVLSEKGFAEEAYYLKDNGNFLNFSGCGNTLNCNHPAVTDLIIASLRHWVLEYHVDGFRFDLASIFTRGQDGYPLRNSPLIDRISQDPILSECRLIAEPWDAAGLYQVGSFFHRSWYSKKQWMEWNDDFRSVMRNFLKGAPGYAGKFATKLCGSQDQYGNQGSPLTTINYITSHDGFTLRDLVSYNEKHNEENGEDNRDGMNNNDSWNHGVEGKTLDTHILTLREREMKNFALALILSQGIPMMLMGDEYGHSKQGNNNTWCHDNEKNWFLWNELQINNSFFRFWKELIAFRKSHSLLRRNRFLTPQDIVWHGEKPYSPNWSSTSHFVAYTLLDEEQSEHLYIAFNASSETVQAFLPSPPAGKIWVRVIHTGLLPPKDFCNEALRQKAGDSTSLIAHSACVLKAVNG